MKEFYRRHLPHWQPPDAVFFITFRLKDSLPSEVITSLKEERERVKKILGGFPKSEREGRKYLEDRRYFDEWDAYLDKSEFGPHWLSQPEIAEIVKEAMQYRDGKEFDLHVFCIMSNHVHVVFEPLGRVEWSRSAPEAEPSEKSRSGWQPDRERSEYHSDLHALPTACLIIKFTSYYEL